MRSQKKNVAMLCLFYFLSYVAFVLPYGYMQTFLEYVGYDVVERGIILSGTAVVAIITQFFIGYLCDKYKTDKKFFNLCLIIFVLSTLVMYQVTQRNFLPRWRCRIPGHWKRVKPAAIILVRYVHSVRLAG